MEAWARECNWGFFLGPDKAGSSWMQGVLERHPTVAVPVSKDLHYFNRFHRRGLEWYLGQFDPTPATTTAVEVCHDYLFDPDAIARLTATFPRARLVVCARHPADRAVSSYLYMVRQGRTRADLSTALCEIGELIDHGRYHHHLTTAWECAGPDRVTVLDFAELGRDPEAFKRHLLEGLGADPDAFSDADRAPIRVAARPRSFVAARAAKLGAGLLRRLRAERVLGHLKSSSMIERSLFDAYSPEDRPVLGPEDWDHIRTQLEPDAAALDATLGTTFQQDWWHDRHGN